MKRPTTIREKQSNRLCKSHVSSLLLLQQRDHVQPNRSFLLFLSQQCLPSNVFGVIPLKENKEIIGGCDVGSRRDTL